MLRTNVATVPMSCRAGLKERGWARCPDKAVEGAHLCPLHLECDDRSPVELIPPPQRIVITMRCPRAIWGEFEDLGIPWFDRDELVAKERHRAHAQAIWADGRGCSGTRLFANGDLSGVCAGRLIPELDGQGYNLIAAHLRELDWSRTKTSAPAELVACLGLAEKSEEDLLDVQALLHDSCQSVSWQCQVWVNPAQSNNQALVHSVVLKGRDEHRDPKWMLEFDEGFWNLSQIQ